MLQCMAGLHDAACSSQAACLIWCLQADTGGEGAHLFSKALCSIFAGLQKLAADPCLHAAFTDAGGSTVTALGCLPGLLGKPQQLLTVRRVLGS